MLYLCALKMAFSHIGVKSERWAGVRSQESRLKCNGDGAEIKLRKNQIVIYKKGIQ